MHRAVDREVVDHQHVHTPLVAEQLEILEQGTSKAVTGFTEELQRNFLTEQRACLLKKSGFEAYIDV